MHLGHAPWPCTTISQCPRHRLQILTPLFSWPSQEREWARASCFCPGKGRDAGCCARGKEGHAPWPCPLAVHYHQSVNDSDTSIQRHRLQILTPPCPLAVHSMIRWPSWQEREWARASCFCPGKGRDAGCCARGKEGHAPWPCPLAVHYHQSLAMSASASSTPDSDTSIQLAFPGKGMGAS